MMREFLLISGQLLAFISAVVIILGLIASEVEARNDQWGESKTGKFWDAVFLTIFLSLVGWIAYAIDSIHPLKTIVLLLSVRICYFDYRVSYLLIRNKVIVGHWFTYTGKTSRWDKLISKLNPWAMLAIRVCLFFFSVVWFLI